ncbi:MAG TPA: alpha/beta fold hydrolase [Thermoanaerobaculia bacterium]|nr:alpha/beta fold hydrolase [Thermoanaerobaculia bacterium]
MTKPILGHRVTGNPDGPPVLLLNGSMMTMGAWEPLAAPLGETYKVIRCDFRGQIFSPGEAEPRLEAHVADVLALLDELGLQRAHVAGTSFGGLVAVRLAALHPERVASLAAITAGSHVDAEFWEGSLEVRDAALEGAAGGDGGKVLDLILPVTYSPEYLAANAELLGAHRRQTALLPATWYRGIAAIISSIEGLDLTPDLPRIQCPTLVLAGEKDRMFPLELSRDLADGIPGARFEVVPGGSHAIVIEKPAEVARILQEFLASVT